MATAQLQQPEGLVTQADALLKLLGGTKTTSSPGDTSALQSTLAGLQGQDYEAMLQAIFNKAGGQIPGLQQALGNAVGARSGGNSAVQAALQKLLADTSTNAMDQVAKLQAQNFATQANVGQSIATATKGTTKKEGTNVSSGMSGIAKLVALLTATQKLGINDAVKGMFSGDKAAGTTGATGQVSGTPSTMGNSGAASPFLSTADRPQMFNQTGITNAPTSPFSVGDQFTGADYTLPSTNLSSTGLQAPARQDPYDYQLGSYDYSLSSGPDTSQGLDYTHDYTVEDYVDPALWLPDYSLFADGGLVKKPEGYADGGTVRAGGSRRSANPEVEILSPERSIANNFQEARVGSQIASASGSDIINSLTSFGDLQSGSDSLSSTTDNSATGGISGSDISGAIGTIGAVNAISGLTGGNSLSSGAMQGLGMIGGLANAQTPEQALGIAAKGALGMASPAAGALASLAMNPSVTGVVDLGLSVANPGYALANAITGLLGIASPAQIATNAYSMMNPNQMMTPEQQMTVSTEQNNPNSAGLTAQANAMDGDALDALMGLTDAFGTGGGNDGGGGTNADGGTGDTGSDGVGGGGTGDSDASDNGMADGGIPEGVADNIDISVSEGEYIVSADVVETLGEDFFNQLQAAFHTPASQQRQKQVQQRV